MILLLDTHTLQWWLDDPSRLVRIAVRGDGEQVNSIVVSAVVPWELAIKTNVGKLKRQTLLANWDEKLVEEGFSELPIDSSHAIRAGLLPRHHNDPFDRVLVGPSSSHRLADHQADPVFDTYGVRRIW